VARAASSAPVLGSTTITRPTVAAATFTRRAHAQRPRRRRRSQLLAVDQRQQLTFGRRQPCQRSLQPRVEPLRVDAGLDLGMRTSNGRPACEP
jgi:hypothetical protein